MKLGIFARTFSGPLDEIFTEVRANHLRSVQFNFALAGVGTVPEREDPAVVRAVAACATTHGVDIAAVSGTFNVIDTDLRRRRRNIDAFGNLCRMTAALGAPIVTLCTGTRHPDDMWSAHPDNDSADAWHDLLGVVAELCDVAASSGVRLAFEPELANVVSSATRARQLLDAVNHPQLGVLLDPANLLAPGAGGGPRAARVIDEAFDVLADDILLVHAKDIGPRPEDGYVPAGRGTLDYGLVAARLAALGYDGAVVMHELAPAEVSGAVAFLERVFSLPASAAQVLTTDVPA